MRGVTRGALAALATGGLATASIALVPAAADATPGSGVTATILAQTTVGSTDYVLREITIQPGGTTGWHFHDGTLRAFVKSGTLTHSDHDCKTDGVYRAGASFTEPSGSGNVHVGRNLGSRPLVLEVLSVIRPAVRCPKTHPIRAVRSSDSVPAGADSPSPAGSLAARPFSRRR